MKHTRHLLSVLFITLIVVMAAGTVVEKFHGSEYALNHVYGAWWFVGLWGLAAAGLIIMMLLRKLWQRPVVFALHTSVLLILLGALLTMLTRQQFHHRERGQQQRGGAALLPDTRPL